MNNNQKWLLAINIVGGILVLGSYYFGLKGGKGANALWGKQGPCMASQCLCVLLHTSYSFST